MLLFLESRIIRKNIYLLKFVYTHIERNVYYQSIYIERIHTHTYTRTHDDYNQIYL